MRKTLWLASGYKSDMIGDKSAGAMATWSVNKQICYSVD